MDRRKFLVALSAATAASAGCLRLTQDTSGPPTTGAPSEQPGDETSDSESQESSEQAGASLERLWEASLSPSLWNDRAASLLDQRRVYLNPDDELVAYNRSEGDREWSVDLPARQLLGMQKADQTLYTNDFNGRLLALDAETGDREWEQPVPFTSQSSRDNPIWPGAFAVGADSVVSVVFDIDSEEDSVYLYATDRGSGQVQWTISHEELQERLPDDNSTPEGMSQARDGAVYVGLRRMVLKLRLGDGEIIWISEQDCDGDIFAADDRVWIPGDFLTALNPADGTEMWRNTAAKGFTSLPTVGETTVYAGSENSATYALDKESGSVRWQGDTGGPAVDAPVVGPSAIWAGSRDGRLYAFDKETGETLTSRLLGSPVTAVTSAGTVLSVVTEDAVKVFRLAE